MLSSKDGLFDRAGQMVGLDQYPMAVYRGEPPQGGCRARRGAASERGDGARAEEESRDIAGVKVQGRTMAIRKILIVDDSPTGDMY